ncbi:MAG: zinc ribbon domain-containing protein [Deltaproteobacteria bacterium]|nr:zinc ribbon domain-containing protein [Deltaproteobacteria bacterium]MBW2483584.1 zinc ribbon domain-containing protein [Deltaproteobacteria bacterium]
MPIYEFRCLKCNDCFEFLLRNPEEQIELRCPKCKSEDFERVMSVSCHTVGEGGSPGQSARAKTRNCPSGSCTTYDIPGHSR